MRQEEIWKPSASISNLLKRGIIISEIRQFFSERGILEVETPYMSHSTVTDVHLIPFKTCFLDPESSKKENLYLITSPEYHMKRLLAAGYGPIFQICRSFRNREVGRYHNPEFTMLEWYRPDCSMYCLMDEVDDLLQKILNCDVADRLSYQQIFLHFFKIDPLSVDKIKLKRIAKKLGLNNIADIEEDSDTLLQLIFAIGIAPQITGDRPVFVYNFPKNQALLAQISAEDHHVAERFEVYYKGIELANGCHELDNVYEYKKRFKQNNLKRSKLGFPQQSIDYKLLEAIKFGIPDSSGVAIGVDRLVMLALGAEKISDVISFNAKIS